MKLQDLVSEVVTDFVESGRLFTALDVSNEVKGKDPTARHKDVRNVVRELWTSFIELQDYDRTPIIVTLANGSLVDALLYHPLSAAWDLDRLYDAQQRAQTSGKNVSSLTPIQTVNGTLTKASDGSLTVVTTPVAAPAPAAAPPVTNTRDLWAQMWQTSPSLFPRRP